MIKTYYPTHTRMGAWLVGVLLGYVLHNLKEKSIKLPKVNSIAAVKTYRDGIISQSPLQSNERY